MLCRVLGYVGVVLMVYLITLQTLGINALPQSEADNLLLVGILGVYLILANKED